MTIATTMLMHMTMTMAVMVAMVLPMAMEEKASRRLAGESVGRYFG